MPTRPPAGWPRRASWPPRVPLQLRCAGIKPSSLIGDAALKALVQTLWLEWTDEADADGFTDFYGLQRRAAREVFIAGEVFSASGRAGRRTAWWSRCSCRCFVSDALIPRGFRLLVLVGSRFPDLAPPSHAAAIRSACFGHLAMPKG